MKLIITLELDVTKNFAADMEQKHFFEEEIRNKNMDLYFSEWNALLKVKDVIDYELIGKYSNDEDEPIEEFSKKYAQAIKRQYEMMQEYLQNQNEGDEESV